MKKFALGIVLACFGIMVLSDVGHAQTASSAVELELDFDALFEWKKPCTMNAEQLEAKLAELETVPGRKVYTLDSSTTFSQHSQLFNPVYNKAYKLKYRVFGCKSFEPESARVMWKDGHIDYVMIRYTAQEGETEAAPALLAGIGDALGASTFARTGTGYSWMGEHYVASARFTKSHDDSIFFVSVSPKNPGAAHVASQTSRSNSSSIQPAAAPSDRKINLDDLLDWKNPVSISREEFEKKLSALETPPGRKPYFLDGGTAESAHVFSPESLSACRLSFAMFKGSRSPDSLRVEWTDSRASRINVIFSRQENDWDVATEFLAQLDEAFAVKHASLPTGQKAAMYTWQGAGFSASISAHPTQPRYFLSIHRSQPVAATSSGIGRPAAESPAHTPSGVPPLSKEETKKPASAPAPATTAAFKLRLTHVNGLLISPLASGEESGHVTKMTLTALPSQSRQESLLEFNQEVGGSMRRCLNEVSKLSQIRHDVWPSGYQLQIGFEDKYIEKDGPSAAVACALLLESALTGKKWDPAFAVTGDLNADGSVQPIGGVRAKIRGATNGSCKVVAVPAKNERSVADLLLLDGPAPLVGITVFGIKTFDDAMALATTERAEALKLALADFESMRAVMMRDPRQIMPLLRSPHAIARMQALLSVAPDCYSAKYLLLYAQGKTARTLSLGGSIEAAQSSAQAIVNSIDNDVDTAMSSLKPDEVGTSLNKLRNLRPMLDQRVWAYVDGVTDYGEVIRSAILNPVRSGARYTDLVTKAKKAAGTATAAFRTLMNSAQVREELGL